MNYRLLRSGLCLSSIRMVGALALAFSLAGACAASSASAGCSATALSNALTVTPTESYPDAPTSLQWERRPCVFARHSLAQAALERALQNLDPDRSDMGYEPCPGDTPLQQPAVVLAIWGAYGQANVIGYGGEPIGAPLPMSNWASYAPPNLIGDPRRARPGWGPNDDFIILGSNEQRLVLTEVLFNADRVRFVSCYMWEQNDANLLAEQATQCLLVARGAIGLAQAPASSVSIFNRSITTATAFDRCVWEATAR